MTQKSSYGQILKASSIMGGAAGINLLLGMIRTKFVAVLIGTTGVGLLSSFNAVQGLIGTLAGLGIQSSAVRDVAAAVGKGDDQAIGRAVLTLRRICWLTGLVGMAAMMLLSPLLSQLTFGSDKYTYDIAALSIIILFANLSGGQTALIQGMRRIGDMARANIIGAVLGTVIAIGYYTMLGLRGIVPTLVAVAGIQLALSWYFARRVPVPTVTLTWKETFTEANGMVRLGIVFMWNGLMGSAVSYITITLITKQVGLHSVGIYSAAFALSGMFVNFVLGAMGADYYPRLTSMAHDKVAVNRLVNEQTEIGLLLALPGLLATMAMAPWIIRIFYTSEFLPAVDLLQWFILGCLGRVISWPLGFLMLGLNESKWFLLIETSEKILHIFFIALGLIVFGLVGASIAFASIFVGYIIAAIMIGRHISGFEWSYHSKQIIIFSVVSSMVTFALTSVLPPIFGSLLSSAFVLIISFYNLKKLYKLLPVESRIRGALAKVPGIN